PTTARPERIQRNRKQHQHRVPARVFAGRGGSALAAKGSWTGKFCMLAGPTTIQESHPKMTIASFATCDLCDAHEEDASGAFRVLPPVFRDFGRAGRFAGPVATVRCVEDNSRIREAVNSPGEGRVLVVDGGASLRRALVGGNLAAAAA